MTPVNKKWEYVTPWSIKEAISIALIYFLLWLLITFVLSKLLRAMPVSVHAFGDTMIALGSLSLLIICLIWLIFIKRGSLITIGIVKCKLLYYIYAPACAIGLYFALESLLEFLSITQITPSFEKGFSVLHCLNATVFVPISEEVYFRGILFSACKKQLGLHIGVIVSALLFGLIHLNIHYPALWYISMLSPVLCGITFASLFHYSKSLLPAIVCHSVFNLMVTFQQSGIIILRPMQ